MDRFFFISFLTMACCCFNLGYAQIVPGDVNVGGCLKSLYHGQQSEVYGSTDTFSINRVVIMADYSFSEFFRFSLEFDAKSREVWDAYIESIVFENCGVRFGQFIVPFGLELDKNEFQVDFIQRPLGLRKLFFNYCNARDIGFLAYGKIKHIEADIAFINGSGWKNEDDDRRKTPAGRLIFTHRDISLGGSFYQGSYFDGCRRDRNRIGANLVLRGESDSLEAEYYYGKDDKTRKYGWYVQGGMGIPFVSPQAYFYVPVRGVFRIEFWDPDKNIEKNEINILTFGINYTPFDYITVQLNYEHHTEEVRGKNDEFMAQVQVRF